MNLEDLPTREGIAGLVCTGCNHLLMLHGEVGPARVDRFPSLDACGCCDSFIPPPPPGPVFLLPPGPPLRRPAPPEDVRGGDLLARVALGLALTALVLSLLGLILEGLS